MRLRNISISIILLIVALIGVAFLVQKKEPLSEPKPEITAKPTFIVSDIGKSVEGRDIEAYTFGTGEEKILLVGTIHGGYEWNTALLSYDLIDYLKTNSEIIPENVSVSIIPVLNPDGLHKIVGTTGRFDPNETREVSTTAPGRFNANQVDLNRNFDCNWQEESTWRGQPVSAGTTEFSEPEARALRDFVKKISPNIAVFYHSQGDGVYSSACGNGVLPKTQTLMNLYAQSSGYPARGLFDAYPITGDAEGWLATLGIPAITVELSNHETVELEKNKAGLKALLNYYTN